MFLLLFDSMKQEKQRYIDLHTHTKYSDGIFLEPIDSVKLALLNGIDVLAITDHDNYRGYFDAYFNPLYESKKLGITLLPGAEITTPKYHLLALNFNPYNEDFRSFLEKSKQIQEEKCKLRVEKLREHGLDIDMDDVYSMFCPRRVRIGKYNLFVAMIFKPECREEMLNETPALSFSERFKYYMGKNGVVGDIKDVGVSEEDAICAVHNAGGLIGIAHPAKDVKEMSELDRLVALGIDFLEIQPNQRDREYKAISYLDVEAYAHQHNLPLSYGSDYHGPTFHREMLGREENVLHPDLEELLNTGYVKIPKISSSELKEVVC